MPINNQQEIYPWNKGFMLRPRYFPHVLPYGWHVQGCDQPFRLFDRNRVERFNNCAFSREHSNVLQGTDGKIKGGGEENGTSYKRINWTDEMVKLLITVLSYVGEDVAAFQHLRCKSKEFMTFPVPGKWKAVSNVMIQRGYHVSPHQCEDKFNDLNKRFKRLAALLGRDRACEVVENPKLIESMDLSNEAVTAVRKVLSCKQLFFKELCSYHNGNRLFLPHDQTIQHSVKLALKSKANGAQELIREISAKRMRVDEDHGDPGPRTALDRNRRWLGGNLQNNLITSRLLQLEEQKLQIQERTIEVEKKVLRGTQKEDLELEKMRLENKVMELENKRFAFKLKCWEKRQQMSMRNVFRGNR